MSPVAMLKNWCDYTVETRYKTLISKEKGRRWKDGKTILKCRLWSEMPTLLRDASP